MYIYLNLNEAFMMVAEISRAEAVAGCVGVTESMSPPLPVILEKTIRIPRSLSVKAAQVLKGFLNKVRNRRSIDHLNVWSVLTSKERVHIVNGCFPAPFTTNAVLSHLCSPEPQREAGLPRPNRVPGHHFPLILQVH